MEAEDDTVRDQDDSVKKQDDAGVLLDLSNIPLEVLELILAQLTDPISQRRLAQVRNDQRRHHLICVTSRSASCGAPQCSDSGG